MGAQRTPITLTNVLQNGSLLQNAQGWTKPSYYTCTQRRGYVNIQLTSAYSSDDQDSGTWYSISRTFTTISGTTAATRKVVYFRAKIRENTSTPVNAAYRTSTQSSSWVCMPIRGIDNEGWQLVSGYEETYNVDTGSTKQFSRIEFGYQRSVLNAEFDLKEVMVINLTDGFGSGNEPSWEWCDRNIPFFEGEGTTHTHTEMVLLENLVPDSSFENRNWTYGQYSTAQKLYGSYSQYFPKGAGKSQQIAVSTTPIVGHKYYGRHYLKTNGEVTAVDCRFEWFAGDGYGLNYVFGWNQGNYPDWTMESNIVEVSAVNGTDYVCRSFVVQGTNDLWADGLMIIDLTESFGAGNEPSKAWCDENIPYFDGSYVYLDVNQIDHNYFKAEKMYVGINNVARKIVKGYIGINGVARKFFYPEVKYCRQDSISQVRGNIASATAGDYMLFAGGYSGSLSVGRNNISALSVSTLTVNNNYSLNTARGAATGVSFNNYAMIAGGDSSALLYPIQTGIEIYDANLVRQSSVEMDVRRANLAGGTVGSYAVFSGGYNNTTSQAPLRRVEAFDTSFVKSSASIEDLANISSSNSGVNELASAYSSNHILFAGGHNGNNYYRSSVDAYNALLQKVSAVSDLSNTVYGLSGAYYRDKFIFAGGRDRSYSYRTIDIYDSSLVKQTSATLPFANYYMGCVVIDDYLVFAGRLNKVNIFDSSLILHNMLSLSGNGSKSWRESVGAASLGKYAAFAGGYDYSGRSDILDIFVLE